MIRDCSDRLPTNALWALHILIVRQIGPILALVMQMVVIVSIFAFFGPLIPLFSQVVLDFVIILRLLLYIGLRLDHGV